MINCFLHQRPFNTLPEIIVDIEEVPKIQEADTKILEFKPENETHKNETDLEFVNRLEAECCTEEVDETFYKMTEGEFSCTIPKIRR